MEAQQLLVVVGMLGQIQWKLSDHRRLLQEKCLVGVRAPHLRRCLIDQSVGGHHRWSLLAQWMRLRQLRPQEQLVGGRHLHRTPTPRLPPDRPDPHQEVPQRVGAMSRWRQRASAPAVEQHEVHYQQGRYAQDGPDEYRRATKLRSHQQFGIRKSVAQRMGPIPMMTTWWSQIRLWKMVHF